MDNVRQLTQDEAIDFAQAGKWKRLSKNERALFQLHQRKLCMPFEVFHEAVTALLGRSVWTHEFSYPEALISEANGKVDRPSVEQIVEKLAGRIGKDRVIVVEAPGE